MEKFLTSGKEALEFKKFLAELGTGILQLLNNIGGLRTASLALLSIIGTIYGYKLIDKAKTFFKTIGDCGKAIAKHIPILKNLIKEEEKQETTAKAAAAAENARAAAMNGIIGVAGLVVTAVSAVVAAIESYNEKQRGTAGIHPNGISAGRRHQNSDLSVYKISNAGHHRI